jgi:hypothetical protein
MARREELKDPKKEAVKLKALRENEFNMTAHMSRIGSALMLAAGDAADLAKQVMAAEKSKVEAVGIEGKTVDRDGIRIANETLSVAVRAYEALAVHGYEMARRNAELTGEEPPDGR